MNRRRSFCTWVVVAAIVTGGVACSRTRSGTGTGTGTGTSETRSGGAVPSSDPAGTYMGRTLAAPMSYRGADWLEREDREATEKPDHVLDVLGIKEGQVVADVGAGSGYFTVRISKRVGARGRVIATDLQPEMLAMLKTKTESMKITNVLPILATESDARLPKREVDLVLMVDVYHELPMPAQTLAQVRAALKPEGRIALVEYRGEDPEVPIKPEHKMTLEQLKKELGANGFVLRASDESLPQQRIVTFGIAP